MKLTFFSTILAVTILSTTLDYANAAGIAACTTNKDGTGARADVLVSFADFEQEDTKKRPLDTAVSIKMGQICLTKVNEPSEKHAMAEMRLIGQYSETYGDCRTGITGGNGIDQGKMTQCCSDYFLGFGSVAH